MLIFHWQIVTRLSTKQNNCRLIPENTITGLRALANSTRLYPGRVSSRCAQRTVNLTDYLSVPSAELELEEEDEEFGMQDAAGMGELGLIPIFMTPSSPTVATIQRKLGGKRYKEL